MSEDFVRSTAETRAEATRILRAVSSGASVDPGALLDLVYGELRAIAGSYFSRERSDHTLQPTELVHEAYLKLVDQDEVEWQGRAHFLGVAARFFGGLSNERTAEVLDVSLTTVEREWRVARAWLSAELRG